jgi:hypothetical protein
MILAIPISFVFALVATLIIELPVALLLGLRSKLEIGAVVLVNVVTNLTLNSILRVIPAYQTREMLWMLEIVVVLAEWGLLYYALKEKPTKLFFVSLVMNACSFLVWVFMASL